MTRVLLFCPTVKLSRATFEAIHGLHFDGTLDRMFTYDNPHGDHAAQNVIYNYRKAERIVKAEGYDYLLTVEDDMLPPPDALEKLIALDADIAYGVYCFRKGKPTINIARPDDLMQCYSLPHNLAAWAELFGQAIECGGLGLGCTLIKRSVFDVLEFHSVKGFDADTQLAKDAMRLGLRQRCDTSVLCGHRRDDGTIVWPTRNGYTISGTPGEEPKRWIIATRPIVFWDYHENLVQLKMNDRMEIDFDHAAAYVEMGLAVYA
jgi:hypothetical protein